jgi:hypothetical protein
MVELMFVVFVGGIIMGSISLEFSGKIPQLREAKASGDILAAVRDMRTAAVAQNENITWWIVDNYLVSWTDEDEDGVAEPEEMETISMSEEFTYSTYPAQGTFDTRGEHFTNFSFFPSMLVWVYGESATRLVSVSANGQVTEQTY